jgi:MSHA biogenesis protein MshQ
LGQAGSVDLLLALNASGTPSNCSGLTGGTVASLAHLAGKWCGANYDRNPVARATFGINAGARVIYLRESF